MTNRVDILSVEQMITAIPSARPMVFLDGQLCSFLDVAEIANQPDNEFGYARFIYNPRYSEDILPAEHIEDIVPMQATVSIRQIYDGGIGTSMPQTITIFSGQVEGISTKTSGRSELVEITAKDAGARLERITVYGRRFGTGGGDTAFLKDMPLVFNEGGVPNASAEALCCDGKTYHVFQSLPEKARYWSCAEAAVYLLSEYLPLGLLSIPPVQMLENVMGNSRADNLDVEGLSLCRALAKCCRQAGVKFRFAPDCEGQLQDRIIFYKPGAGRKVELNRQWKGTELSISGTGIMQMASQRRFWPVTHCFIGQGDLKIFEATFELIRGWDPAGQGRAREEYSTDSESFDQVRDVYRKWCLNEAGDYSGQPYNSGPAFDFSRIFETENYICRRRKFLRAMSAEADNEPLGYYLKVSYDNGLTWQRYDDGFDVSDSQCGIWLDGRTFSDQLWSAATAQTLRFRITASVESDERMTYSIANGPINSSADTIDHIFRAKGCSFRKVSSRSIFYNKSGMGLPDEIDNTPELVQQVRTAAQSAGDIIETVTVQTPVVYVHYQPGDRVVCSPDSRDVLGVKRDTRSIFLIESVRMDFQKQLTELKIIRRRDYDE